MVCLLVVLSAFKQIHVGESHFYQMQYFRARTRGGSEGYFTSLSSFGKMSRILMEIDLLLSSNPSLLPTCHTVASTFCGLLEKRENDPIMETLYKHFL